MPRAKKKPEREPDEDDDDDEESEDEEEGDGSCEPSSRDYVMARIAAARASAQAAIELCDVAIANFVEPDDDKDGTERGESIDAGLEALGSATRSLEEAHRVWDEDDEIDLEEGEDYESDDED
jgi:hypothetical protein